MDLPGHGRSPIPFSDQPSRQYYLDCCPSVCQDPSYKQICRSFSFAELSADVLAVFDHFAQEDSSARTVINVIVAHSYGYVLPARMLLYNPLLTNTAFC